MTGPVLLLDLTEAYEILDLSSLERDLESLGFLAEESCLRSVEGL